MVTPAQQTPKVSTTYIQWILRTNRAIMAHLYQFTSAQGAVDYFTDFDADIFYNGVTWKANSLRFEGLQRNIAVGVDVDEKTIKIWAAPTDTMFGANFLSGVEEGLLDGAIIVRSRAVWNFATGNAAYDVQNNAPFAVWTMFTGYMAAVVKGGASHVEFKVKSPLHKLDINMPRNYYQPGCLWTLFDAGCTLSKSTYAVNSVVATSPPATSTYIPVEGGIVTPTGADGFPNYAQGRLLFTSGVNNGLEVLIGTNDLSNNLILAYPLNDVPSSGDGITFSPGCSKSFNTCSLKYSNQANFRGFDKVPPISISI